MDEKILHKVDTGEPIEWLNSFVCVKTTNGKIQLCLGPTHLNKCIIRSRHSSKLVDNILHKLNGAQYFTVVDSTTSFFNHKLDEEPRKLMMSGTPYRRYRYLRMPMGASLSSNVYQYKMDGHLEDIQNCMAITDDIIIYGFDKEGVDHDKTVRKVIDKAKAVRIQFNHTKCQFWKTEVKFFGLMLTRKGGVPDPAKIETLKKLSEPKTENLLQSFLGIVNYLSWFDSQIANLKHNLRALLRKGNEFQWNEIHSKDFKSTIQTLCENKNLLRYYRSDLNLYLETDAS